MAQWQAVDNSRVKAAFPSDAQPRRVVDVAATLDVISTLAGVLTKHRPPCPACFDCFNHPTERRLWA